MNRRDLLKASAALNLVGYRAVRADPVGGGDVYIDAGASGTGHSGTYADPFSTDDAQLYFASLSGDLGNRRIRFKAGTTFVGRIAIADCDNYLLEPYGDGPTPIISNHVDISDLTWIPDDGARGGPTEDVYFIPVSGGIGSAWTAGQTAVIVDDGTGAQQCEYRRSYAELTGALYQCNESAYPSGWPFLQWWDTTTSPNRMWIRGPAGWDPNAISVFRPVALQNVLELSSGEGVTIRYLDLQCGAVGNFLAAGVSGLTLDHVDAHNCGGDAPSAQDCFNIVGTSKASRATDIVMRSCRAFRSYQQGSSHGLEISWLSNFTVDDFEARDIQFHGIEFWGSCSDGLVRRMKARQTLTLMQFQSGEDTPADTLHERILIQNPECVQRASYAAHAISGPGKQAGGNGVVICDFSRNRKFTSDIRIYNGSFDLDGAHFLYAYIDGNAGPGLGNNAVTFKGNTCRLSQLTHTDNGGMYCCAVNSAAHDWTLDRNVYQFGVDPSNKLVVAGAYASNLFAYQALWHMTGAATNEDSSVVAGPAAPLYSVPGGTIQTADLMLINESVAAIGLADSSDPFTPITDIRGGIRDGSPDAGAYEYATGPAQFAFADFSGADLLTTYTSLPLSLTGLTGTARISVGGEASALYSVNSMTVFTASPGTVVNGDMVRARVMTGGDGGAPHVAVVTINGVSGTYTVTTDEPP